MTPDKQPGPNCGRVVVDPDKLRGELQSPIEKLRGRIVLRRLDSAHSISIHRAETKELGELNGLTTRAHGDGVGWIVDDVAVFRFLGEAAVLGSLPSIRE